MKQVLVTYATMAGSTAEVAETIGETLNELGFQVDLKPVASVDELMGYDAVVVGGPMILGWHRAARRFLRRHRQELEATPFALFATAMSLTESKAGSLGNLPVFVDNKLASPPEKPSQLSIKERYATVSNYARPMLRSVNPAKPVSVAFFGGRLNYGRLKWWAVLLAIMLVGAQAGDKRNSEAIESWAKDLPTKLGLTGP
jgi:menaquinone-dependent protoporphyrinogen oxidase